MAGNDAALNGLRFYLGYILTEYLEYVHWDDDKNGIEKGTRMQMVQDVRKLIKIMEVKSGG